MTPTEEQEMHALAVQLVTLTAGTGWEATRYGQVGMVMEKLAKYCAVCDCQKNPIVQCRDCGALYRRRDGCPNDCHDEMQSFLNH